MSRKKSEHKDVFGSEEQWCPQCRMPLARRDGYFECPECNYAITDEEVDETGGYPTLESTEEYADVYPTTYDPHNDEDFRWYEL